MSSQESPSQVIPRRGRQQRSLVTQERILTAATRLFVSNGYLATTMAAIAAEAGVAVQSLYVRFGGKLEILSAALDVSVVGDTEPVPLLERDWLKRMSEAPDGQQALGLFVDQVTSIMGRTYPLYAVVQAAAASEAGELLTANKQQRYNGVRAVAAALADKPGFSERLTVDATADLLYAVISEEHYGLLVVERGWSPEAWQAWCNEILGPVLFPPVGPRRKRSGPRPGK